MFSQVHVNFHVLVKQQVCACLGQTASLCQNFVQIQASYNANSTSRGYTGKTCAAPLDMPGASGQCRLDCATKLLLSLVADNRCATVFAYTQMCVQIEGTSVTSLGVPN